MQSQHLIRMGADSSSAQAMLVQRRILAAELLVKISKFILSWRQVFANTTQARIWRVQGCIARHWAYLWISQCTEAAFEGAAAWTGLVSNSLQQLHLYEYLPTCPLVLEPIWESYFCICARRKHDMYKIVLTCASWVGPLCALFHWKSPTFIASPVAILELLGPPKLATSFQNIMVGCLVGSAGDWFNIFHVTKHVYVSQESTGLINSWWACLQSQVDGFLWRLECEATVGYFERDTWAQSCGWWGEVDDEVKPKA